MLCRAAMSRRLTVLLAILLLVSAAASRPASADEAAVARGAYLFAIGGCAACHTDKASGGAVLAGGPALKTPFGTFYGPNITPDPTNGIGAWRDADFVQALRQGIRPDGAHLFPVFPYPSFTLITDADLLDLKAYIFSLPPVAKLSRDQDVDFLFSWRFLQVFWRWLNFTQGPYQPDVAKSAQWNRGAYLVQALGHCGECHTPRGSLGGMETDLAYSGTTDGPDGHKVPNITPDKDTGIGSWSHGELLRFLRSGLLPSGDAVGSLMGEVIEQGISKLTDADRDAVAAYLESLPAIANPAAKATPSGFN
jgi:mono/diheme cytochrome c family protein